MRFLVDAQLPPALARQLVALGHQAEHVSDCGLLSSADDAIQAYAIDIGAVVVSKDEDFVTARVLGAGPSVVWIRLGNLRKSELLKRMDAEIERIVAALEQGESVIEVV